MLLESDLIGRASYKLLPYYSKRVWRLPLVAACVRDVRLHTQDACGFLDTQSQLRLF